MIFFLLGSNVAYYETVDDISVLDNLVPVDKETCICSLDISDSLVYASDLICNFLCTFFFVRLLHNVPVLLVFTSLWVNDRVYLSWMDFYFPCSFFVCAHPIILLSCVPCMRVIMLEVFWVADFSYMVGHEILDF